MKISILLFLLLNISYSNAQYWQQGGSWDMTVKNDYTILKPNFVNSDGLTREILGIEKLKGWNIKYVGILNYKQFFYKLDFNIFGGFETFKVNYIKETGLTNSNDEYYLKLKDTVSLTLSNEFVSIGSEILYKFTKQPNSFYVSLQQMFFFSDFHSGSSAKFTEDENWLVKNNLEIRFSAGLGYKTRSLMLFSKYTPKFRLANHKRGITFSKVEIGLIILGQTFSFGKKNKLFIPKL